MAFEVAPEVQAALSENRPVVALESTIIAHGMPHPQNLETAQALEQIIRDHGAVPATIAVIGGDYKVGLSAAELFVLATEQDVMKLSVRDLPLAATQRRHGATTVAATMRLAARAGIRVFATGGIGGVHRGAETTFDISADLTELAETPVAVVSAGAKSILDIGRTLEMLETLSVPVIAYRSDAFPAFYSRESGFAAPVRLDTQLEIAHFLKARWELSPRGGVSIANPIHPADEIPAAQIEAQIKAALDEARKKGIAGKETTPFLLKRVNEATAGASLKANIALVKNNARLAAEIAVALSAQ
ncbi:pseudouridine-5'-phosphate glycosidase [Dongia sedimenti]|uniref:Pseudouridine-5'-phosphate glycosidase n=1 Tax=Dongia sedimenti TaxID=3064282 RepID=A0ABU0YJ09_9PROT|nr:pseudouridine-5'-phosphate glycosidase [Rhodospirillaceae bacterium R-7]